MDKRIKRILISLLFFAFADGMYYNFLELWMKTNNMEVKTISTVLSICAIVTALFVFICSNIIKRDKIKPMMVYLIFIKTILLFILYFLNGTGLNILAKFIIIIDYAIDVEIYSSVYPLITTIQKSNKLYMQRELVYNISYYLGVLFAGLSLGNIIGKVVISYNTFVILSALFLFFSGIFLYQTKINISKDEEQVNNDILFKLLKKIRNDKISKQYIIFLILGNISYYTLMGIFLTILISNFDFVPETASNIKLILGIISVGIGYLILNFLTSKNDYLNLSIKYLVRIILYILCIIFPYRLTFLIAFIYIALTSCSYSHIADAPYINRFTGKEQLAFANLKDIIVYLSRAIGTYLCGILFVKNIKYNFLLSAILLTGSLTFAFIALKNRKNEEHDR